MRVTADSGAGEKVGVSSVPVFRSTRPVLKTNRLRTGSKLIAAPLWLFRRLHYPRLPEKSKWL